MKRNNPLRTNASCKFERMPVGAVSPSDANQAIGQISANAPVLGQAISTAPNAIDSRPKHLGAVVQRAISVLKYLSQCGRLLSACCSSTRRANYGLH
jgi:hypothetical protein